MRLLLHIGTAKTGTTSFQHWLASNRDVLSKRGVLYPRSLGRINHRLLSVYAIGYPSADWRKVAAHVAWAKDYEEFAGTLPCRFDEEIAANLAADVCVVSSEHLHAALTKSEMVERVRDLVSERFDAVEVWIHLRPQVEVAVSLLSTRARLGQWVGSEALESVGPHKPYYNWYDLVTRWAAVFGAERVRLVPYARMPDMTACVAADLGIPLDQTALPAVRNRALGWGTVALLNVLSAEGGDGGLARRVRPFLERLPAGERLSLARSDAQRIQARFDEGNRRLVEEWPHALQWSDLEPDWSRYGEEGNIHKLERMADIAAPVRELLECYEAALDAERIEKLILAAELAQARGEQGAVRQAGEAAGAMRNGMATNPMHDPARLVSIDQQLTALRRATGHPVEPAAPEPVMHRAAAGAGVDASVRNLQATPSPRRLSADPEINGTAGEVDYTVVLKEMHAGLEPRRYLEIGVRRGRSLRLAECAAVGVDPEPVLEERPRPQHRIFETTSDAFFRDLATEVLAAEAPDLVFIDGMHLFEYALRDFINVERWSGPDTLVVIDDMYPNHPVQASRERSTGVWTGDVWKLSRVLRERRPDLLLLPLNTAPTGLLVVAGLDPENRVLSDCYEELVGLYARDGIDPDPVCLQRSDALSPSDAVLAELLGVLRRAREAPARERAGVRSSGLQVLADRLAQRHPVS